MNMLHVSFGKAGQIKIQQMAFMLIAVTMFFVLVGLAFLAVGTAGIKESATELEAKNAQLLVTKLANSPEFSCGESYDQKAPNCIDADKFMVLIENKVKYDGFWGDLANIEARIIYPIEKTEVCSLSNYPNCNSIRLYSDEITGFSQSNFVTLCRKAVKNGETYDLCEMGKLFISYNKK